MKITHTDVATGLHTELTVTQAKLVELIGEAVAQKPFAQVVAENDALRASALAKLAVLGLTEAEAAVLLS